MNVPSDFNMLQDVKGHDDANWIWVHSLEPLPFSRQKSPRPRHVRNHKSI
jgi:hypothetical protein